MAVMKLLGAVATPGFRRGWVLAWLACLAGPWLAQAVTVRSRSGEFVVHSQRGTTPSLAQAPTTEGIKLSSIEPDPLAVSCERIKEAMLGMLGARDRWQGPIHLWLHSARGPDAGPRLASTRYADGWRYDLHLPDQMEPAALVRVVVEALLVEIANRAPGSHSPEVPIWLVEGFTGQLLSGLGQDLTLQPSTLLSKVGQSWAQLSTTARSQRLADANRGQWIWLRSHEPLTFNDLSLPYPSLLRGENLETYRASAQLFLSELLQLPDGQQAVWAMLGQLTQTLNWQTAFLRAFQTRFRGLLDVEKWWALTLAQFTGRTDPRSWSPAMGWQKLDEVLGVIVEVQDQPKQLPRRATIPLRQIIAEWDFSRQTAALRSKLGQLYSLQTRISPELAPLVGEYIATVSSYLELRGRAESVAVPRGQPALDAKLILRDTLRRLENLERQRARLAPAGS